MVTQTTSFRLRASTPQPRKGGCATLNSPAPSTTGFVLQTFKAEKSSTNTCEDKSEILCSNDMIGLGGLFVSASYQAQRFLDPENNELVFQATETKDAEVIEEDEVPGTSNFFASP